MTDNAATRLLGFDDAEARHWRDRAALLDPAAYEFYDGTAWSQTVTDGETWYLLEGWHIWVPTDGAGGGAAAYWFLRDVDANNAMMLPAGTTLEPIPTSITTQSGHAYICKPALVTAGDTRYEDDPRGLYYERLDRLRSLTLFDMHLQIDSGQGAATKDTESFPSDFDEGMVTAVSVHDAAWLTLHNTAAGKAMNTQDEIDDAKRIRFASARLIPFQRTMWPQVQLCNAEALTGWGVLRYHKLPTDW